MQVATVRIWTTCLCALFLTPVVLVAADPTENARKSIVAAYQRTLVALERGDAEAAMQMDTNDWFSVTVGQKPRTRKEMEPFIRREIRSMKPPPGWSAVWKPEYERNGTSSGIQIYDLKLVEGDENTAVVLCLVGNSRAEVVDGAPRTVWFGFHVRDTWTKTSAGWKRRMHEKLTVNE